MIVDLFAGPGGWSEGLRLLQRAGARYSEVGIDNDEAVYLTRQAAGHQTLLADVSALDPAPFAGAVGLIASPPCQLYSAAGSRHGHAALDVLTAATGAVAAGDDVRTMARRDVAQIIAPRVAEDHPEWDVGTLPLDGLPTRADAEADRLAGNAVQVLEPARWIHALQPEWVALEQVPGVLPLWEALAEALGPLGYQCATGIVDAADYGVPQHRRRAVLLAAKGRPVELPAATHGPGRPRPWVTMAEALGWGFVDDAARTVCGDRVPRWMYADNDGTHGRTVAALNTGRDWKPGGDREDAQTIPLDLPAPALTAKSGGQWHWQLDGPVALNLTIADALTLQSFRPDYPVQGNKTKQFEQVGNAVPPLLAAHVLAVATGRTLDLGEAA